MVKKAGAKRKAWKKAKIEDVEEAIEDERLVAKLKTKSVKGKGPRAENALFRIDTKGTGEGLSVKTRREIARAKIFPPKAPRLPLSGSAEAQVDRMVSKLEAAAEKAPVVKEAPKKVFNVWEGKTSGEVIKELREDWENVQRLPQPVPLSKPRHIHTRVNAAPAVVPPHEGQSVNPPEDAYKEIAFRAAAVQLEKEHEEEEVERHLQPMTHELRDVVGDAVDEMDEEAKVQMLRSLSCTEPKEGEGSSRPEVVARSLKPKSETTRNKEKRRKILDLQEQERLKQRKLEKSVGEVGRILKELQQEEEDRKQRAEYRRGVHAKRKELERTEGAVGKCRRIGLGRFDDAFIAVPEEGGSGTLRGMAVKTSAVRDRLESIIQRGLLPPEVDLSRVQPQQQTRKGTRRARPAPMAGDPQTFR